MKTALCITGCLVLACAALAHAEPAAIEPCAPPGDGMPTGPGQRALHDGGLGVPRRVCARTEVAIGGEGYAVIEPSEFYGNLRVAAPLAASVALSDETELFGALEVVRYQTVISSFEAEQLGLGDLALGATHAPWGDGKWKAGLTGRLVLPTASSRYDEVWPFGSDAGFAIAYGLHPRLLLHAQSGGLVTVVVGSGGAHPRGAWVTTSGLAFRPWSWFSLVLDAHTELGYAALLDVFAIGPALRFAIGARLGAELGAMFPIAGRERALAAAGLRLNMRL